MSSFREVRFMHKEMKFEKRTSSHSVPLSILPYSSVLSCQNKWLALFVFRASFYNSPESDSEKPAYPGNVCSACAKPRNEAVQSSWEQGLPWGWLHCLMLGLGCMKWYRWVLLVSWEHCRSIIDSPPSPKDLLPFCQTFSFASCKAWLFHFFSSMWNPSSPPLVDGLI